MTDPTGQKEKRKYKKKFKFIDNRGTYKTRKDFIETQYVNGVRDEMGNLVIRAMTEEEIEFLNNFYKETVHANFNNSEETKKHEYEIKSLERDNKAYSKVFGEDSPEIQSSIARKKKETSEARKKLGNVYSDYDEQKEIRQQNYQRNQCVFNKSKHHQKLDSFEEIIEQDWDTSIDDTIIEDLITESED